LGYGAKSFSASDLKSIVDRVDIVVFPDINPDGRAYSMAGVPNSNQAMWRKNRNPVSGGGATGRAGVDVNRNYDFLWDFPIKFSPSANANTLASTDPGSDLFHGTGPFSEPESRNVQWLVDQFANARYFVDVHSYTGDVLYPWGDDENQTIDSSKSFKNPAWDGQRGVSGDAYKEYLPATRLAELQTAANVMRDGINAVRGQGYVSKQGFWLWASTYPTSGTSEDWAFTREFLAPNRGKLSGFVIEFNKNSDFFPTWAQMVDLIADIDAGLIALCLYARPSRLMVILCAVRHWFSPIVGYWATWHRVFPPELWGPYGPWTRVERLAKRIAKRIVAVVRGIR
jgi:hypothetical protein